MAKILRKQSSIENLIQDLADLVSVDNGLQSQIGSLNDLETTLHDNLVVAINEIEANSNNIDDRLHYIEVSSGLLNAEFSNGATTVVEAIDLNYQHIDEHHYEINGLIGFTGQGIVLDTNATALAPAINELHTQADDSTARIIALEILTDIGNNTLDTSDQTLIGSINELHTQIDSNTSRVYTVEVFTGLGTTLDTAAVDLAHAINELHTQIDSNTDRASVLETLSGLGIPLDTTATDIISAINEIHAQTDDQENRIIALETLTNIGNNTLDTNNPTLIGAINEIHAQVDSLQDVQDNDLLRKDDNLASLVSAATARINLDVYNRSEVESLIRVAEINLGSSFTVDDHTAKDALADLTVGDNVFVVDDGDAKWAIYKVTAVTDGNGSTSSFEKIMDQDIYLNAISKETIKTTYESNDNTNAYTDDEQFKVSQLSVTSPIDLDKVVQNDELNTSLTLDNASFTDIPSSFAVKAYINNTNVDNLKSSNNLSDLSSTLLARTNLDVYSKDETFQLILDNAGTSGSGGDVTGEEFQLALDDIAKMKKNYFFGLNLLGKI